jgi:hypothetical protein
MFFFFLSEASGPAQFLSLAAISLPGPPPKAGCDQTEAVAGIRIQAG